MLRKKNIGLGGWELYEAWVCVHLPSQEFITIAFYALADLGGDLAPNGFSISYKEHVYNDVCIFLKIIILLVSKIAVF